MTLRLPRSVTHWTALATVLAASASASAATVTWDGGGGNLNWLTPANWSGDVLPGPGDDVVLDAAGVTTITLAGNATVNSLNCADALTVINGTLTVGTNASVGGLLSLVNGGITSGTWAIPGGMSASSATTNVLDGVTINGSFTLSTNFSMLVVKNGLTLNGTANLTGSGARIGFSGTQTVSAGNFQLDSNNSGNPAALTVEGASTVTFGPAVVVEAKFGQIGESVVTAGVSTLINQGVIREDTAGGTLPIGGETFINQGTVEATDGTLTVGPSTAWINDGLIRALTGGTVILSGPVTPADFGDVRNVSGTVRIQTTLDLAGGTFTLDATTGVYTLNGCTFKGGTIDTTSGVQPIITNTNNFLDAMTVHGDLSLSPNFAALRVKNGLTLNGILILNGTGSRLVAETTETIGGTGEIQLDSPSSGNPAQLAVDGTSVLTIGSNVSVVGSWGVIGQHAFTAGVSSVINLGTIVADTPNTTLVVAGESFTNQGTAKSTGGTLRIAPTTWTNSGSISAITGTVRLEGTTDLASVQNVSNVGGTVQSTISVDMANQSFTLTPANGVFTFDGGTWSNGTITFQAGATPLFNNANTIFQNMVVNGDLTLTGNFSSLRIRDAFTMNGIMTLSGTGSRLIAETTLTINAGTFRMRSPSSGNPSRLDVEGTSVVTLAPSVVVESGWGLLGESEFLGGTSKIVNKGTIRADTAGTTTNIVGEGFENQGTCEATAGTFRIATTGSNWANTGLIRAVTTGSVIIAAPTSLGEFGDVRNVSGTVRLQSPIALGGGTLTTNATTGVYTFEGVTLANGTLAIGAGGEPIVNNASNTFTGMTVNGTINFNANFATIRFKDGLTLNGTFNLTSPGSRIIVDNTLTIGGAAAIQLDSPSSGNPSRIDVEGATTLTLAPTVLVEATYGLVGESEFTGGTSKVVNQGTLRCDTVNGLLTIVGEAFENQGTCEATAGTFRIATTSSNWINSGLIRALTGGTVTISSPTSLAQFGDVRNVSGTVRLQAPITLNKGTFATNATTGVYTFDGVTLAGGTLAIDAGGSPSVSNSSNIFTGMTVNGVVNLDQNFATIRLKDGLTLNGAFNLTGSGSRVVADNTLTIGGSANIQLDSVSSSSPAQLAVDGASTLTLAPSVLVESKWGTIGNSIFVTGTSSVVNNGTLRSDTTGNVLSIVGEGFQNNGTVEATNGATLVLNVADNLVGGTLTGGVWKANNSTIRFGAPLAGTPIKTLAAECVITGRSGKILDLAKLESIATTGILRLNDGAILTATPATGTLVDSGLLFTTGVSKLNINGGFSHQPTAVMTVTAGAVNQIIVDPTGPATLSGILQVSNGPGFTPAPGDEIVIIDAASLSGSFDTLTTCEASDLFYTATKAIYVYGQDTGIVGDFNGDGFVGAADLALLLGSWGPCTDLCCKPDLDQSGDVGPADIAILLGSWG